MPSTNVLVWLSIIYLIFASKRIWWNSPVFFIIMTFEEMSTFLTCSEQLDQIKLNLLERVPTVAISTFFENKL